MDTTNRMVVDAYFLNSEHTGEAQTLEENEDKRKNCHKPTIYGLPQCADIGSKCNECRFYH